ncbi:unnamed protein product [Litomosoides sigmodontis]|uniref:SSD domain-containing protein n=1 Tax=Litomosoides sigmodontis TaxID=42156 RepID=A0A3P6RZ28_LITSI|nr:unnamed protein product [Litomosoides sigmodontis]
MIVPEENVNSKALVEDTIFVRFLKGFFRLTGRNVAARPYFFISISLFVTAFSSSSVFLTKISNEATDFTPKDARAIKELKIYNDFFGHDGDPVVIFVFVTAKDGGSMLGVPQLNETIQLLDSLANDVKIRNEEKNKTLIFSQFCTSFCEVNEPVRNVYNSLIINERFNGTSSHINLAYPISTIIGQRFRIDDNFFGVRVDEQNNLLDARLVLLHFRAILQDSTDNNDAKRYEMAVTNFLQKNFTSNVINAVTMSSTFITAEIVRAGLSLLPFTAIGFIIMCTFSVVTTTISSLLVSQFHYSKIAIAIIACVSPLLACTTALGILLWCGLRFGSILCVTPLLVLAIGVDDAFLMINYWQQTYQQNVIMKDLLNDTEMEKLSKRMCNMLQEVVMVVMGRHELQMKKPMYAVGHKNLDDLNSLLKCLLKRYCSTLCTTSFSVLTVVGLLLYWSVSLYGTLTISIELKPEKLMKQDSDIVKVLELRDKYIMPHYAPALVFVSRPGNLNNLSNILKLHKIGENEIGHILQVDDFEALPSSAGQTSTKFWLRDYANYINDVDFTDAGRVLLDSRNSTAISIKQYDLKNFLSWPEYHYWNGFIQFDPDKHGAAYLKSYFFMISSQSELGKWSNRARLLNQLRNVADRHSVHEVSVFDDDAKFLDIIGTLLNHTVQSSVFTVIFMMLVCSFFIPQCAAVIIATLSILSIFIGVLGLLSLWKVDLDPIVMSALIMSIGFSVDIPAHVTYHFFRAGKGTNEASLQHCLSAIGFPVLQAATSTLLCVISLQFSDLHMAHVFMKTMILVVIIGFIHGLVIIPVLYTVISHIRLPRRTGLLHINAATSPKVVRRSDCHTCD